MQVILRSKSRRVLRSVERDYQWYDARNKVMLHGRGGRMEFQYDPKQKRAIPMLVPHEDWVWEDDYDDVMNWFQNNRQRFNLSIVDKAKGHYILIELGPDDFEDVSRELYNNKIQFDYDEQDLRR